MTSAAIAVPAYRQIEVLTSLALAQACRQGYGIMFNWNDSLVGRSRARLVTRFLREYPDSDVMIFVDSDIIFEIRDISALDRECRLRRSVVAAPVSLRAEGKTNVKPFPGQTVTFGPNQPSVEIEAIGPAFMAIPKRVLVELLGLYPFCNEDVDTIPFSPMFDTTITEDRTWRAEDFSFCQRVREAGFSVWVMPSLRVGHTGTYEFWIEKGQEEAG